MEQWDQDYIGLEKPGYFRFGKNGMGEFVFGTVNGLIVGMTMIKMQREWNSHGVVPLTTILFAVEAGLKCQQRTNYMESLGRRCPLERGKSFVSKQLSPKVASLA